MSVLAGVGAVMGVTGSVMRMSSELSAIDSQANALNAEAEGLTTEADVIVQDAARQERQYVRKARLIQGRAVAYIAASGVQLGTGTPLMLELDNARQAAIGQFDIRRTGRLAAASRLMAAAYKRTEAGFVRSGRTGVILQRGIQAGSILTSYAAGGTWKGPGFGAAKDTVSTSGGALYSEGE